MTINQSNPGSVKLPETPDRQHRLSLILSVNVKLFLSVAFGALALVFWQHASAIWWQLYLVAGLFGLGSFGALVQGIAIMVSTHNRDRALYAFENIGGVPKGSKLAGRVDLDKAGMR